MKKKIFAALAVSAMAVSMMSISAFAAGADGDGDVITDDPGEVIDIDDPVEVDPVVTEPEIVETTVTQAVEPVAPAASPKTGNAPVAMAVIPVALAAAAVVRKNPRGHQGRNERACRKIWRRPPHRHRCR